MLTHISIPEGVTVVVLDLDGTIYRKPRMALHMLRKQWRYLPSLVAERRYRCKQRKALNSQSPVGKQPFSEQWYRENYLPSMVEIIAKHYEPQPWLQPLIDECRQRKIKLVILSDYEAATEKLQALGLKPKDFDLILSTGDQGTIKPDPILGFTLLNHLYPDQYSTDTNHAAFDWRQVLFIGDRQDTDGLLAQSLGAQFILV